MKLGAGLNDIYKPSLWYFDKLIFLKDHEIPRSSIGSDKRSFRHFKSGMLRHLVFYTHFIVIIFSE